MRTFLVIWFLVNLIAGVWLTFEAGSIPKRDDIVSLILDEAPIHQGEQLIQLKAAQTFRDAADRSNRDLAIVSAILIVDAVGIIYVAAWVETARFRRDVEQSQS